MGPHCINLHISHPLPSLPVYRFAIDLIIWVAEMVFVSRTTSPHTLFALPSTVGPCYNKINISQNNHKRFRLAGPWGKAIGYLQWVQLIIAVLYVMRYDGLNRGRGPPVGEIIASDKDFPVVRHQAAVCINLSVSSTGLVGTHFTDFRININKFLFTKMHMKMSSRTQYMLII